MRKKKVKGDTIIWTLILFFIKKEYKVWSF
nr:MAG TPA: hypothetical protein [Bacteriophage sp.]